MELCEETRVSANAMKGNNVMKSSSSVLTSMRPVIPIGLKESSECEYGLENGLAPGE